MLISCTDLLAGSVFVRRSVAIKGYIFSLWYKQLITIVTNRNDRIIADECIEKYIDVLGYTIDDIAIIGFAITVIDLDVCIKCRYGF